MLKARESVFWPGISNDIREVVEKCGIFQASSMAAKPIGNVSEVPSHAWNTLGTDLLYWNKMDYLVVGDYFSKFLIVRKNSKYCHTCGDQGIGNGPYRIWKSLCAKE